mgnify:CR=1 FL=1
MNTDTKLQDIAIRYRGALLIEVSDRAVSNSGNNQLSLMFQAELMRLGYALSRPLFEAIGKLSEVEISELYRCVIPLLWNAKGADKKWRIFYPNFPKQVMKASDAELFWNAITHYWSYGRWTPCYKVSKRLPKVEATKFVDLTLANTESIMSVFTQLLASNTSLSEVAIGDLDWFLDAYKVDLKPHLPEVIPFKEQLCRLVGFSLKENAELGAEAIKTSTDVLRVMSYLSEGDVSLAENCKFISWKRSQRRFFAEALERVVNHDDVARHGEKWKRAFHGLHIGDYAKLAPKTFAIADQLRNGKITTYLSKVESAIKTGDAETLLNLLGQRPGELARRIDHLMRVLSEKEANECIALFERVAHKVDSRVLIQLYGHIKSRGQNVDKRVVMPKGSEAKARVLTKTLYALPEHQVSSIKAAISKALVDRYSKLDSLGKVWIEPHLLRCPVPLAQRSASDTLVTVARGTRLPFGDKSTLRMFIWWKGQDVDLSCVLYDAKLKKKGHISYTNLRDAGINACHSGDITHAPKGAAEFIDIDIELARKAGVKYIAMNVLDFTGKQFSNYEECFAGWMTRDFPNANEVFDPKTVQQKVDLRSATTLSAPVVFDLESREAVWLDLNARTGKNGPNNVESNSATLNDLIESSLLLANKLSLYELFEFHAKARGERVFTKEEADTVFSLEDGVTPFDISTIGAEYL